MVHNNVQKDTVVPRTYTNAGNALVDIGRRRHHVKAVASTWFVMGATWQLADEHDRNCTRQT